jgi:hypothetical protein
MGRVAMFRPVRWDYFYTPVGKSTVRLVRSLIKIRRSSPQLRKGDHFFYNDPDRYQSRTCSCSHEAWEMPSAWWP